MSGITKAERVKREIQFGGISTADAVASMAKIGTVLRGESLPDQPCPHPHGFIGTVSGPAQCQDCGATLPAPPPPFTRAERIAAIAAVLPYVGGSTVAQMLDRAIPAADLLLERVR